MAESAMDITAGLKARVEWAIREVPGYLREDARQEAWLGVVQAARRFDGRCKIESFAAHRARGAVLDYQRFSDPLTRRQREKVRLGVVPPPVHLPLLEVDDRTMDRSLEPTPERHAEIAQLRSWLRFLTPEQARLFNALLADLTVSEAGRMLGITVSTANGLWLSGIARIRRRIRWSAGRK